MAESAYGKHGHCSLASNDSDLKHLPDCTGWDWSPPKTSKPARMVSDEAGVGEVVVKDISAHEWKFGDWAQSPYGIVRFVSKVPKNRGKMYFVNDDGSIHYFDEQEVKNLPDCTGFDWKPPKPMVPPEGYRLVTEGSVVKGDRVLCVDGNWYESISIGSSIAKSLAMGVASAFARKILPPEGYRLLTEGETTEIGDLFFFEGKIWEPVICKPHRLLSIHVPHARKIEPRYRPFANAAEFAPHRGRWIYIGEDLSNQLLIYTFNDRGIWHAGNDTSWEAMFAQAKFDDGSPFGVKMDSGAES